jgi:peptide deformylase
MILPIIKYPNKVLRIPGKDIPLPASLIVRKLAANMVSTVQKAKGIGLAAPQVGQSLNIIVINLEHLGLPVFVLLNPKITTASKKKTKMEEGCLSIPGVFGLVARPETVTVKGFTVEGKEIEFKAEGILSKVAQHEIDHINGILIIDKISKYTEGKELISQEKAGL